MLIELTICTYIQTLVDEKKKDGLFILTGSQQFDLMETMTQSLAGISAIVNLLPLSYDEAYQNNRADFKPVISGQ